MYCPRCNLHSEEYVEMCPLCDGPMAVDAVGSGVMKTPTVPEKEEHTGDLPKEETLKLTEEEVKKDIFPSATTALEQEKFLTEAEREKLRMQEFEEKEEEPLGGQEYQSYQQKLIPTTGRNGHKRFVFLTTGCILAVLIGVLGYFFFFPSEKASSPKMKKVVVAPALSKPELAAKTLQGAKPPIETTTLALQNISPEKPEVTGITLPSANAQGRYSIHVGSFKEKEPADYLKDKLQNKGYPVLCSLVSIPGKGDWYRVKVGYYSNLKDAEQVASKLKTEEKVFTLILRK